MDAAFVWSPYAWLNLRFSHHELERQFLTEYTTKHLYRMDANFSAVPGSVIFTFFATVESGLVQADATGRRLVRLYAAVVMLQVWLVYRLNAASYQKWRIHIVVILRLLCTLLGVPTALAYTRPATNTGSMIYQLCGSSGCILCLWHSIGLQVPLANFLILQPFFLSLFLPLLPQACHIIAPDIARKGMLTAIWRNLQYTLSVIADIYFPGYEPPLQPPTCVCYPTTLFLQLLIGFLLPAMLLYRVECQSRIAFLKSPQVGLRDAAGPLADVLPFWVSALSCCIMLLMLLAGAWHVFNAGVAELENVWKVAVC